MIISLISQGYNFVRHILLVEDNDAARVSLTNLLRQEGFQVTAASNAEDATQVLDESINIALLDLRLPGKWGDLLAMHIHEVFPATRIIFLTAEDLRPGELQGMVRGSQVVGKPCQIPELLRILAV